ncbi:hypothetical protein ACLFKX_12365 [Enterobacter hormaechei]
MAVTRPGPVPDHTREHVPVLVYGPKVKPGSLGHRESLRGHRPDDCEISLVRLTWNIGKAMF